ncbi:MAG: hypothetical protein LC795_00025 [Acidobacteria bacterium]|nr:hypothetical protein [Acidobacteriota bacterium]
MSHTRNFRLSAALLAALVLGLAPGASAQKDKDKKKGPPPQGTAVLWREPADVSALDLLQGPGGAEMKPDLSRLTFVKEEKGGYSKKYRVRDAAGRVWVAKIGKEAQPETAVTRLVWAAGYPVEVTYLAPCVKIDGAPRPKEAERCEGGGYANVRFEARPGNVKRLDAWRWESNPFSGTRELRGLKIMMALVENWDMKDDNNRVLAVNGASGTELQHVVSDLGATIGKTGGQSGPIAFIRQVKGTRNEPEDYANDKFVEGVEGGRVRFNFSGKNSEMMRDITVEDARWLGGILSRLSDEQIEDAFRAANYNPEEVRLLAASVRGRINQLTSLPAAPATP